MDVAVIGSGFIGKQHIEAIHRIPNAHIVALCEPNEELARQVSKTMDISHYYTDLKDMIQHEPTLKIVHNCTPSGFHYDINKVLIEAGLNVYCEKPFTSNADQSSKLVDLLAKSGLKGGVNFNYRHNLMVEEMKERVSRRMIGDLWFVDAEYLQDWLLRPDDYDWRLDASIGGPTRAISDIGSHCFDTVEFITGHKIIALEVKRLIEYAERFKNNKKVPVTNEDAAIIFVEFEGGSKGLIRVSQVTSGKKNDLHILVEGTEQSLEWYQERPDRLWIGNRDRGNEEVYASRQYLHGQAAKHAELPNGHAVGWKDAFTDGIREFYDDVLNGTDHDYVTFSDADHLMKLVDAALVSDQEQRKVKID